MNKKGGFTLIELLTVVAVLGLLSSIILISVKSSRKDAEQKKVMQFSASIQHGLGTYAIGMWRFENNPNDSSENGNNGVWYGTAAYSDGIMGKAASFDTSNRIIVSYGTNKFNHRSGAITYEFWIYINTYTSGYMTVLLNENSAVLTNLAFACEQTTTYFKCQIQCPTGGPLTNFVDFRTEAPLESQRWYHVAVTYDGNDKNTAKMFLNTKEVPIYYNGLNGQDYVSSNSGHLFIGGMGPGFTNLNGLMDEVRLYDSYITISEVRKHYAEGLIKIGLGEYYNRLNKS